MTIEIRKCLSCGIKERTLVSSYCIDCFPSGMTNNSLRYNPDGTCNCRRLGDGCFFQENFGNRCECDCHKNNSQNYRKMERIDDKKIKKNEKKIS